MKKDLVEQYYDNNVEKEWNRLESHKMEFAVTWKVMMEMLPMGSSILDIGGGPGKYSIQLLKSGFNVTLVDLSSENIRYAREKARSEGLSLNSIQGNALDLSKFSDESFDVVLLMGPLYHLTDSEERKQAIGEALRVLKPSGLIFASFITKYAFLLDFLKNNPGGISQVEELVNELLKDGTYKPSSLDDGFTEAFFIHPLDIAPLMKNSGLRELRLMCTDGLIMTAEQAVNALPEETFLKWVNICYRLSTDPVVWGTAEHMLYVGQKNS